jgi:hypothetical protein
MDKVVFICEGGIGKNIAATAVVRNIKKKYPDQELIVVAGYPDVFMHNPNVSKVYAFGNPLYFYDDQILNKDTLVIKTEPYLHYDYLQKTRHLTDVWCEQVGVEMDSIKPELFLTKHELSVANEFINGEKRESVIFHITGGKVPDKDDEGSRSDAIRQMYRRNLPMSIAQKVADGLKDKYRIIQVKGPTQPGIKDGHYITTQLRALFALAAAGKRFVLIDSFMMHATAAFDKRAVVCWGGTNPKVLGYETHVNLIRKVCPTPMCHRPNDYLFDVLANASKWDCPYGEPCLEHEVDQIIEEVTK